MNEIIKKKWASIYANDEFICVQTCSGLRRTAIDPEGALIIINANPELSELGNAIRQALAASRVLAPNEIASFFDVSAIECRYENWVSSLLNRFNYASRQQLFKNMRHCQIESADGVISIRPTMHEKTEAWSGKGIERSDYVLLDQTASAEEIGNGAALALSRCIN